MLYSFIDANIWGRVISQGRPGCEQKHFEELKALVQNDKIILLHAEATALELEKFWTSFPAVLKSKIDKLEQALKEP